MGLLHRDSYYKNDQFIRRLKSKSPIFRKRWQAPNKSSIINPG